MHWSISGTCAACCPVTSPSATRAIRSRCSPIRGPPARQRRWGALVVLERETSLGEYAAKGVGLDAVPLGRPDRADLHPNTRLHDGAAIVRGERSWRPPACCRWPRALGLDPQLGTRHRAAVGISEQTDAVVVVVSEETGQISYAERGHLVRDLDEEQLRAQLDLVYRPHRGDDLSRLLHPITWRERRPTAFQSSDADQGGEKNKPRRHVGGARRRLARTWQLAVSADGRPACDLTSVALFLALALASALWWVITTEQNPERNELFPSSIPVEVINAPPSLVVVGEVPQIQAQVRAPSESGRGCEPPVFELSPTVPKLDPGRTSSRWRSSPSTPACAAPTRATACSRYNGGVASRR